MDTLLSIDSVSKHFGDYKALNNVSVDIPKGAMLLANNQQKVYANQVVAEIKKDANLINVFKFHLPVL